MKEIFMFNTVKLEWIDQWLKSEREAMVLYDSVYVMLCLNMKLTCL